MQDLAGKTAVVTGGASGIGLAMVRRFLDEGMNVVIGDIEQPVMDTVRAELAEHADRVEIATCDVRKIADLEALRDAALKRFGGVHVLCNNAGVGGGPTIGSSVEMWQWVVDVDLTGVTNGIVAFLDLMLEQNEGHIINTASLAGLGGVPGMGPYCAAKFAVVGLSESLFYELEMRRSKVRVSALCPGFVKTQIAESGRSMPPVVAAQVAEAGEAAELGAGLARQAVAAGIEPELVAAQVLDAILHEEFWILTHPKAALGTMRGRLAWMEGGQPPMISLENATRGD